MVVFAYVVFPFNYREKCNYVYDNVSATKDTSVQ